MVIRSMIGLDTNVLVRLFAHDGDAQSELARDDWWLANVEASSPTREGFFLLASLYPLAYIRAN